MKTARDKRRTRRELLQQFERTFDATHFDYKKRLTPVQGKSKLIGIAIATGIYGVVFGIAYFAWNSGRVAYELFMKTTWVMLLPATAAGMFGWLFAFNRLDNEMRGPIQRRLEAAEGEHGMLWRYAPILAAIDPNNSAVKTACNRSREKKFKDIDVEDYCSAVHALHAALSRGDDKDMSADVLQEVEANLSGVTASA